SSWGPDGTSASPVWDTLSRRDHQRGNELCRLTASTASDVRATVPQGEGQLWRVRRVARQHVPEHVIVRAAALSSKRPVPSVDRRLWPRPATATSVATPWPVRPTPRQRLFLRAGQAGRGRCRDPSPAAAIWFGDSSARVDANGSTPPMTRPCTATWRWPP